MGRLVIGYDEFGHKRWGENIPAEPAWGHALGGSQIVEQPARSLEERTWPEFERARMECTLIFREKP